MSLFHCHLQVRHLHRMGLVMMMMMICLVLLVIRIFWFLPYDDPGDDPRDLGGTGGGPLGPGPGPPGTQGGNDSDLPSGEIEFQYGPGGNPPPHYPGGGVSVTVPEDSDSSMELIPGEAYGPSPDDDDDDDDRPPYPMEVHVEPPPPGGPPDAPGAKQPFANPDQIMQPPPHVPQAGPQPIGPIVPLPKHPHFSLPGVMRPPSPRNVPLTRSSGLRPDDVGPKAKLSFPSIGMMQPPPPMQVATTPKQAAPMPIQPASVPKGVKDKGFSADPDLEPENEPGSSSNDPPAVPGLLVTEGEFPIIHETPAPSDQVPIPETGSDSDSDATVDYRDQQSSLLALVEGDEDILIELPSDFKVPDFVPLDGDKFASWLTRQDKVKAGRLT